VGAEKEAAKNWIKKKGKKKRARKKSRVLWEGRVITLVIQGFFFSRVYGNSSFHDRVSVVFE